MEEGHLRGSEYVDAPSSLVRSQPSDFSVALGRSKMSRGLRKAREIPNRSFSIGNSEVADGVND